MNSVIDFIVEKEQTLFNESDSEELKKKKMDLFIKVLKMASTVLKSKTNFSYILSSFYFEKHSITIQQMNQIIERSFDIANKEFSYSEFADLIGRIDEILEPFFLKYSYRSLIASAIIKEAPQINILNTESSQKIMKGFEYLFKWDQFMMVGAIESFGKNNPVLMYMTDKYLDQADKWLFKPKEYQESSEDYSEDSEEDEEEEVQGGFGEIFEEDED